VAPAIQARAIAAVATGFIPERVRIRNHARTQKQTDEQGECSSAARRERNLLLRWPASVPDWPLFGIAKLAIAVDNYCSIKRQSRRLRQIDAVGSPALRQIRLPAIGTLKH